MTELLPCPFCGAPAAMSVLEDDCDFLICAWVSCPCGVQIHERLSEEEAAMQWNCRAATAVQSPDPACGNSSQAPQRRNGDLQPGSGDVRAAAIEECAQLIESGAGMCDLIDQDDLDEQAKMIRRLAALSNNAANTAAR